MQTPASLSPFLDFKASLLRVSIYRSLSLSTPLLTRLNRPRTPMLRPYIRPTLCTPSSGFLSPFSSFPLSQPSLSKVPSPVSLLIRTYRKGELLRGVGKGEKRSVTEGDHESKFVPVGGDSPSLLHLSLSLGMS